VVDDNIDAAELLSMLLEMVGHQVLVAFNATDAIRVAEQEHIDVFLLDIGLPDMNGYELAKTLRSRAALENKFYVALTGYGQSQDRQLSEEAGFVHHLIKPVDHERLFQVLAEVTP
jgi:CheY-like chemotaxis protein